MHDTQVGNDHPRTGSGPIRLILADDHTVMRQGLRALFDLHEEFSVIGEADSADAAVSTALELRPDLVLMDLRMPGSGIEATRQITQAASDVRVLILTTYDNDQSVVGAIEAGAVGYLLKSASTQELLSGVRSAVTGRLVITPEITVKMARHRLGQPVAPLSKREREVLTLVSRGNTNAQVARRLGIGEATVKTHLHSSYRKLNVTDRASAAATAVSRGLIPPLHTNE